MADPPATRIALIADTHMPRGPRRLPDACLEALAGADLIVHAGDFTGPEVLAEIAAIGPPLVAVHGNVDAPEVAAALPARATVEAGGATLAVVHDAGPRRGRLERMRLQFPGADAVVFGHSHMPLHESAGGFQIFNPGSPTERRRAPAHTMGIAVAAGGRVEFELFEISR
ncbi:MAG TPA: metallophosphoesterase family protein [Solirubrobacterales bacterium]